MIETINKQRVELEIKIREFDLSYETDPRFSSPKLDVCLCDDGVSFPPLESRLEAVLDPPLAALLLVAPSSLSTLRGHTAFDMTFPDPPLPLAPLTEFELGETLSVNASIDEDASCFDSNIVLIEVDDSVATPIGMSYMDVEITVLASTVMDDDVSLDPLDPPHASSLCSLPSPSPECYIMPFADLHDVLQGDMSDCMNSLVPLEGMTPPLTPIVCT